MIKKYLLKIRIFLENDDFESLNDLLQMIYSRNIPDEQMLKIDEVLTEATLYTEFKDEEYKQRALELIAQIIP